MTCKNTFLEADRFCTQCGERHENNTKNRKMQAEQRRERSASERAQFIENNINFTPMFRTARETAKMLVELYELKVTIRFTNSMIAWYQKKGGSETINFGYQRLELHENEPYQEYATLQHIVNNVKGLTAAKVIACHEVAHAVVYKKYGRVQPHGVEFVNTYKEILGLVL